MKILKSSLCIVLQNNKKYWPKNEIVRAAFPHSMEFFFSLASQWADCIPSYVKFMKQPYNPYQLSFSIFYKN